MEHSVVAAATLAVSVTVWGALVHAQQIGSACASRVTPGNLVQCALGASLFVQAEGQELQVAQARKLAVSPLLPSNPVLALSGSRRTSGSLQGYDWSATLSQELEVGGQRGARRDAAEASIVAQSKRVVLARRETAALAWTAFFQTIAASEQQRLAAQLNAVAQAIAHAARARADKGLIAGVDADVADASAVRVLQTKLAAERRLLQSRARLASLLGFDPADSSFTIDGALIPLEVTSALAGVPQNALRQRPETLAFEAERRAFELRANALRKSRISNPTLSLFVQQDGFNERVLGVGLAFPIPVPGNLGRTYVGEIAEAEALARRAHSDLQAVQREIVLQVAIASQGFASLADEVEAFSPARISRAQHVLVSLGEEVEAGRLSIRDAMLAQQTLIELLQASVEVRLAWCVASVDLARAVGAPLEGKAP